MKSVMVLGAAGAIGSMAARTLCASEEFEEVVLADLRPEAAAEAARAWPPARTTVTARHVDVSDPGKLRPALAACDLVVNCTGPFYRFGPPLLDAAIETGTPYVDVCDDLDPTRVMLARNGAAESHGVCALIGMGNSPGLANVLAKYCAEQLLDSVTSVDIMHIHGGEPAEGPAVLKHRIHAMRSDVPIWENGAFVSVRMLEPDGLGYVREVDFRDVGTYPVYPYPHPETITLPRHLPGIQRVTNRGVVFPLSYFDLTRDMVLAGTCGTDPIQVNGAPVIPLDFAVAHVIAQRPRLLAEAGIEGPAGCLRIDVAGRKDGADHSYVFSLSSRGAGAAEGTGIPAALGALLIARGAIGTPGVHAPEAVVDPVQILALAGELLPRLEVAGAGGRLPIHIDHIGPDGGHEELDLAL